MTTELTSAAADHRRRTDDEPARRSTERFVAAVVGCLIAVTVAVVIGRPAVVMLATPWCVLLALGLSSSRRQRPGLTVAVDGDRVMVGDPVPVTATVSGVTGRVAVTPTPVQRFGATANTRQHDTTVTLARPATGPTAVSEVSVTTSVPADRWGIVDVGRVSIEVVEPYGLLRWTGELSDPTPVRVHPEPDEIRTMVGPRFVRRAAGTHRSRAVDRGVEYADLRPYGPGDELRDINWRASARAQELWVSQRHPDRATDVVLLLDSFIEAGHDAATVIGLAVEAAVAVAESHLAVTDRVGLVELGGLVRWVVPGTGALQLQRLVDTLLSTGLHPSAANRDLAVISPRALPPRSLVLALSPLLDDRFIDALLTLAARGHDLAVVECEPAGEPPQDPVPVPVPAEGNRAIGDPAPTLDRLGWRLWQAERDLLRDRLTSRGVAVARWDAGQPIDTALRQLSRRRAGLRSGIGVHHHRASGGSVR